MKINEIIKEKRQELNLTQEKVAEYLGVSTPAVNKWEKGVSYPDITILPGLARLLKTDLNTLLSFNEDLSDREIGEFVNKLTSLIQNKGLEAGYKFAMVKIRDYSNCHRLIYSVALILEGSLLMFDVDDSERYYKEIESLYQRVLKSEDVEIRNQALSKMISKYIKQEEYKKAQKLIDSISKQAIDKSGLQANLFIKQGKNYRALEILEQNLLVKVNEIQVILLKLMGVNMKENKIEEAEYMANTFEETAKLYDLWEYNSYTANFELAVFKKDEEESIRLLKCMFEAMKKKWDINSSLLYKNIKSKENNIGMENLLLSSLIKEIERDEKFEFLRSNQRYLKLINQYKKQENE
ncbi:MAG TPA: helix-turn-helix transcriptional regulator [Tissierellaceae bacterium]|nr:helix-turn-helix transcriptional regulator [Tissierellaceae bacterium]